MRNYILFILTGLIVVFFIIYSEQINSLDAQVGEYEVIQKKIDFLRKDNLLLKEELLSLSSYTYIASKAAEMGFIR